MQKEKRPGKEIILEFLDFLRYKIENESLTFDEAESIARTLEDGLNLVGTADDLARFYGKTKTNVTTVIDRKMLSRPKRLVLHSFNEFRRAVPRSWIHKEM